MKSTVLLLQVDRLVLEESQFFHFMPGWAVCEWLSYHFTQALGDGSNLLNRVPFFQLVDF